MSHRPWIAALAMALLTPGASHAAETAQGPEVTDTRDDVTLLAKPPSHDARIVPAFEKGKLLGMRVTELHPKSPLKILGLRNDDVILTYRGAPVADAPTRVTEMIEQVREESCGVIRFKRGKQTRTLKCKK